MGRDGHLHPLTHPVPSCSNPTPCLLSPKLSVLSSVLPQSFHATVTKWPPVPQKDVGVRLLSLPQHQSWPSCCTSSQLPPHPEFSPVGSPRIESQLSVSGRFKLTRVTLPLNATKTIQRGVNREYPNTCNNTENSRFLLSPGSCKHGLSGPA
jgi:hypothetical protein